MSQNCDERQCRDRQGSFVSVSWWECVGRGVVSYRTNVHPDTHSCTTPQFCLTEHCSVVVTDGKWELTAFSLAEGRGIRCELSSAEGNFLFDWSRSNSISHFILGRDGLVPVAV